MAAGQWGYMAVGVFLLAFMLASLLYAVCLTAAKAHPGSVCRQKRKSRRRFLYPVRLVTGGVMPVDLCGFGLGNPSMISLFVSGESIRVCTGR
ncbi:MAG: hypothetical protein ACLSB9_21460 [Hydrogeniiclostridium mannosilyticum]